jgi:hypothetical protein
MNIAKLKKLKKWILAEPRRYCQEYWLYGIESAVVREQQPPCGTAGCLAGNACLMEGFVPYNPTPWFPGGFYSVKKPKGKLSFHVNEKAGKILGLTEHEKNKLFDQNCSGWPAHASRLYYSAKTPKGRAQAAAQAIDALINTRQKKRAK